MSTHIIFENAGEIDPLLITTFGVNVKDNDNAIGFFGTGLKYALSILTRSGCAVVIQSGMQEFRFGKRTIELRGKPFEFVTMNDEPLGFTTEVGKTWELWMAYRELFCNAQDEGGRVYQEADCPTPENGITRVIVTGGAFAEIAANHGKYFLKSTPFMSAGRVEFHHGRGTGIYYRNVMVGALGPKPTMYTYNVTRGIDLTEDRTMKYAFSVGYDVAKAIVRSDDRDVIRNCVTAPDVYQECDLDYDHDIDPSAAFIEVVGSLVSDRIAQINQSALRMYRKHTKKAFAPSPVKLNSVEVTMLENAKAFCELIGFDIGYPIVVVESLGNEVYGLAMEETIYIAHRAFTIGTKTVAGTLIEEYVHLKHGYLDCTRPMQNYLLDRMMGLGELATGGPL